MTIADAGTMLSLSGIPTGTGFTTSLTTLPIDNRYLATAGWPGGPTATLPFVVDQTLPVIGLRLGPIPDGGFLRDQVIPAVVTSTEQLDVASTVVTIYGTLPTPQSATVLLPQPRTTCGSTLPMGPWDLCYLIDLAVPTLNGVAANLSLSIATLDTAGHNNDSFFYVPVTRFRWTVPLGTSQVTAAPAIDSNGRVWAARQTAALTGDLVRVSPTGATATFPNVGAVESLAIANVNGTDFVYFATNTGGGSSAGVLNTNASTPTMACTTPMNVTHSAIALYDGGIDGNGRIEPHAVMIQQSNSSGAVCDFSPSTFATSMQSGTFLQPLTGSSSNLVIKGTTAYFQQSTLGNLGWALLGSTPQVGGSNGFVAVGANGLALVGNGLAATHTRTPGALVLWRLLNDIPQTSPSLAAWNGSSFPPVAAGDAALGTLYGGGNFALSGNWMLGANYSGTTLGTVVDNPIAFGPSLQTSPVVGTNNLLYAVSDNGQLMVFSIGSMGVLTLVWRADLMVPLMSVRTHPTLDCNRGIGGSGRPGSLYFTLTIGSASQLVSLIVDSTKLDPNSPWPKWQRTAGNAGNPAFPLNPGCP